MQDPACFSVWPSMAPVGHKVRGAPGSRGRCPRDDVIQGDEAAEHSKPAALRDVALCRSHLRVHGSSGGRFHTNTYCVNSLVTRFEQ